MEGSGCFSEAVEAGIILKILRISAATRARWSIRSMEVLLLCLLAVLAGAGDHCRRPGSARRRSRFSAARPLGAKDGTPSHDQLGAILATVDAERFEQCFVAWVAAASGVLGRGHQSTARPHAAAVEEGQAKAPIHAVSAFATRQRLVLRSRSRKGERIDRGHPCSLEMAIEGAIVSIDAIGCQREIARISTVDKSVDYIRVKAELVLHDDVAPFVAEQKADGFKDTPIRRH